MLPVKHIEKAAPLSDEQLLAQYQSGGDQQVLATLYLRYTDLVYGTAMKYLKEQELAKDAVMNIYQELVRKLQQQQVTTFRSWLYVVTKNHCLMFIRKQKNSVVVEFQPDLMQSEDFSHLDEALEKEKELQKLESCIENLAAEQQQAIRLFYLEGKCYNEIVTATGQEWNKIRSLVQNGRRNLKNCMEK
ncbi:RNA polymerase sigma factor [Sediminibacterium ginsengisoli]|uniref:RNA polymerase sigma-70 factor, ECF subfamily n=1 Tax=Sediminibacterium ginsengisoli TaxID=413434 RepID=A0A1T4LKM9_9BACT|nr:sigma-70 family RNA polymerase sigma factor [Sediminibacterium ginsengisoli]SJZ55004.1 RNA polymerase sigma-70 factor, ECF subfamily [Sediminibacterium ginsengisoli]